MSYFDTATDTPPGLTSEDNQTLDHLARMPTAARPTVRRAALQRILLYTEGWMLVRGEMYDVRSEHVGAGIHRVWLEKRP